MTHFSLLFFAERKTHKDHDHDAPDQQTVIFLLIFMFIVGGVIIGGSAAFCFFKGKFWGQAGIVAFNCSRERVDLNDNREDQVLYFHGQQNDDDVSRVSV